MESVHSLIAKLAIQTVVPKIAEKELAKASYIVIRHAYSEYNYRAQIIKDQHGEESEQMHKLKGDPTMYDPCLHEYGVIQAESNQGHVNDINFKVVFISPLQRTL